MEGLGRYSLVQCGYRWIEFPVHLRQKGTYTAREESRKIKKTGESNHYRAASVLGRHKPLLCECEGSLHVAVLRRGLGPRWRHP